MKRSTINQIMSQADEFIRSFGFHLPPFAYWTPDTMKARRSEMDTIVSARMGWDITDFGAGRFEALGLFLFTLRNGTLADLKSGRGKCYAEKIMVARQDQVTPMHRHVVKAEDIINRGGADLAIELFAPDAEGGVDPAARVTVPSDGIRRSFDAGGVLILKPGESVTLMPGIWHAFWGEGGDVLIGEVSTVNDDLTDNVFRDPVGRFSDIEEDVPPKHLLVSDYDIWLG